MAITEFGITLDTTKIEATIKETLSLFEDIRPYLSEQGVSYLGSFIEAASQDIPKPIDIPTTSASAFTLGVSVSRNLELFCSTIKALHAAFNQDFFAHVSTSENLVSITQH